jgi:hypothetical protein
MMTRTEILNTLASRYQYQSYLEIGVATGVNFHSVRCAYKVGVDPADGVPATHKMTSDDFFAQNKDRFDLIFIDGLHESEQVNRDIDNSLTVLKEGGTIVLHDCNPLEERIQMLPKPTSEPECWGAWTGDVWKSIAQLRMCRPNLSVYVIDTDWGCGIVRPGRQKLFPTAPRENINWALLESHRNELLNLVKPDVWFSIIS